MIVRRLKKAFRRPVREAIINGIAASLFVNRWARKWIYRIYGMRLGNVWIGQGCTFASEKLEIGDGSWINKDCVFENTDWIRIGNNCDIAYNVIFITNTHAIGNTDRRAGSGESRPIVIGDGCWIGAGAILLPGITIGNGCVIAAGAVVTKDCEPDTLYGGNPARGIRKLP